MKIVISAAIILAATGALAQQARPFGSSPVPCNTQGWKDCRVSFDGSTVTRTYVHPRGGSTTETHSGCTTNGTRISCPPGSWRTDGGYSGAAARLTITTDASGRPRSTSH